MKVDSTTVLRDYSKHIILLEGGYVLLEKDNAVVGLGSWDDGSCFKGHPNLVNALKAELDKEGIVYKFPSLFLHRGMLNLYDMTIYVSEVAPWDGKPDRYIKDNEEYEWVDPFLTFTKE